MHVLRFALLTPLFVAALALSACVGGQSGSEGPSQAVPCACTLAMTGIAVRAEVTARTTHHVTADVLEVLGAGTPPGLAVGRSIGGTWEPQSPCGDGLDPSVGDTVLLFYGRGSQDGTMCVEYTGCSGERCGPAPADGTPDELAAWDRCDEGCLEETRGACALHEEEAWLNGRVALGEETATTYRFGELSGRAIEVPHDELSVLSDDVMCMSRFGWTVPMSTGTGTGPDAPPGG